MLSRTSWTCVSGTLETSAAACSYTCYSLGDEDAVCYRSSALRAILHAYIAVTRNRPHTPSGPACPQLQAAVTWAQIRMLQDPAIKEMAENIARDPAFAQMTAALQQSMGPGAPGIAGGAGAAGPAAAAAAFDPSQYMEAMSGVLQNPAFMQMAEQLGSKIMQVTHHHVPTLGVAGSAGSWTWTIPGGIYRRSVALQDCHHKRRKCRDRSRLCAYTVQQNPEMMAMMSGMQDPSYREAIEGKLQNLKNDPELEKIMKEIETGGPAAMMKCAYCQPAIDQLRRKHYSPLRSPCK